MTQQHLEISPATMLVSHVIGLWPHRRFNAEQAESLLTKSFRRAELTAVMAALTEQFADNPDSAGPNWGDIGRRLGEATKAARVKGDGADQIRARFRASRDHAHNPVARELVAASEAGNVPPSELENWLEARIRVCEHGTRFGDSVRPWTTEERREEGARQFEVMANEQQNPFHRDALNDKADRIRRGRAMRVASLAECYRRVVNLRPCGPATADWQRRMLEAMRADAHRGGCRDEVVPADEYAATDEHPY